MVASARPASALRGSGLLSPKTPVADSTLALQMQQFMDDYFFRVMHSSLGKTWSRQKALTAALELFQLNGVMLTQEDIDWCCSHDDLMIPMIVRKMPFSVRENFESLSTQLNVLVHTATRVRTSVEDEDNGVEAIMQEQDTGAIKEQILKESVIQASKEVASLLRCQDTWVASMEKRLHRLSRSAENAEIAQQQLLKVETQLDSFHEKFSEKSKLALTGFAELSTKNLIHSTFANWAGVATKFKNERNIRKKFEQDMLDKETMLIKLKERSLQNVRAVLIRKSRDNDESCMFNFFNWWKDEVGADQREEEEKKHLENIEKQLKTFTETKAANAKKFMARMGDENDEAVACMAFAAWAKGVEVLKEDNKVAAEAEQIQAQLAKYKEQSLQKSAKVMNKMAASTQTSMITSAVQGWAAWTKEKIKARDLENTLMGAEGKFKMLNSRQKGNASKIQTRVNEQMKQNLALRTLSAWQCEAKVNHVEKYFSSKMEGKRKQLQSVQTLFKSFAKQLEDGLGKVEEDGESSGRPSKQTRQKGGSRNDNSQSLPNIHSRR